MAINILSIGIMLGAIMRNPELCLCLPNEAKRLTTPKLLEMILFQKDTIKKCQIDNDPSKVAFAQFELQRFVKLLVKRKSQKLGGRCKWIN